MQDFRKLKVWEKAHHLVVKLYEVTDSLPKSEHFGLTSQIRRAAVSIPTNIAEGCGRGSAMRDHSQQQTPGSRKLIATDS